MPFKKPGRSMWYVSPSLEGFGRVGPWSTGLRAEKSAAAVEAWLHDVSITDPAVVRGIVEGHYSLRRAYQAHREGTLRQLKEQPQDPPLREVAATYRATVRDRRILDGLDQLDTAAPKGARFSWITDPKRLTDLLNQHVAKGRKVNSVHRSLYAAIKGLLTYQLGNAKKRAITADVVFKYEDDTRHVDVTPAQLHTFLDALDPETRALAVAAVLTGIDRGPLLRLTPSRLHLEDGCIEVPDTKNRARWRMLEVSDAALAVLRRQAAGKEPAERLFPMNDKTVEGRWQGVKHATGIDLRFKDLRHVFANAWVDEGGALADLGKALGHTKASTSLKYTSRQRSPARARMEKIAARLGLDRDHLRVEKGA